MTDFCKLLQAQVEGLFLRLHLVDDHGPDLRFHGGGEVADEGGPGAADEVLGQGIPPLGESQRHDHAVF